MAHVRSAARIFVDLDGVLADFDEGAKQMLGITTHRDAEPVGLWRAISHRPNFFADLPMMPEAKRLWAGILQFDPTPIVLTGVPMIQGVCEQKTRWVRQHLGLFQVVCTPSRDKWKAARPGDILIDDWLKYAPLWMRAGGIFVQYVNVDQTLYDLQTALQEDV